MDVILMTVISCSDAVKIVHRLVNVTGLTLNQKTEIIQEIRKTIPFCPVVIVNDKK